MKWLTPKNVVVAARLSVTSEELIEYTIQSEDEETIEERFQKVGCYLTELAGKLKNLIQLYSRQLKLKNQSLLNHQPLRTI